MTLSYDDLKKMYYMSDNTSDFVLLTKRKDGRFYIYESGDKASDVIAKVICEYDKGEERDKFIEKIMSKVKAFDIIKK